MAAITWYMTNDLAGTAHQEMSETDPGAEAYASPVTGWIVGTGSTNRSALDAQTERAASTFADTTPPSGTPATGAGAGDCLRSTNAYTGDFDSGNWVVHACVRANSSATGQDGRMYCRLLRDTDPTGATATEITGGAQQGSDTTDLATSATQDSSVTFNPGAFSVAGEYIFVQIAWERFGAASMTTADVNFRVGNASSNGTRVISANFTPPAFTPVDPMGMAGVFGI